MANGKRNVLTFEQRLDVLKDLETSSISSVAKKYNVHHMTIRRIIEKAATITKFAEKDKNEKMRKKIRKPTYEELEQQLITWFLERKTVGEVVTDALFLKKAAELRQQIEACSHFKVSRGWLANFKRRHSIRLVRSYSEKPSADTNGAETFVNDLKKFFEQENINLGNVYNMYESLLLWKALPVRTFAGKIENCASEHKISKESVAVGLCANATGTHKIMPLVINKYKQPKALRNFTNQSPDEILFVDWFENYFKKAVQIYQLEKGLCSKVVLLISNSSSHKFPTNYIHDDQFQVIYLPLNIVSLIQPINQVIIDKMKRCYRHKVMQCLINYGNGLEEFYKKYTIKDCIEIISKAWNEVTRNNIKNMWKEIIIQLQIKNEKEEEGGEIKEEKEEDVITEIRQICTQIAGYDVTAEYIEDYLSACTEEENRFLREAEELDTGKNEHILGEKEAEMDEETNEGTNEERDVDWVEEKPEVSDEGERISECGILLKQEERKELENIFLRLNCYKSRISRSAQLHLEGLKLSFLGDTQLNSHDISTYSEENGVYSSIRK